jgi:hypothetical protein
VSGTFSLVFAVCLLAAATVGSVGAWPPEVFVLSLCAVLGIPAWLSGIVFLSSFMEKALYGPAGRSWLKVALFVAGSWLFMLLWFAAWCWPYWSAVWAYATPHAAIVLAGYQMVALHACALAQSSLLLRQYHKQRQYHEEWGRLPIEIPS